MTSVEKGELGGLADGHSINGRGGLYDEPYGGRDYFVVEWRYRHSDLGLVE